MRSLYVGLLLAAAISVTGCNKGNNGAGTVDQSANAVSGDNVVIQADQVEIRQGAGTTSDAMTSETDGENGASATENAVARDLAIANDMDAAAIGDSDNRASQP